MDNFSTAVREVGFWGRPPTGRRREGFRWAAMAAAIFAGGAFVFAADKETGEEKPRTDRGKGMASPGEAKPAGAEPRASSAPAADGPAAAPAPAGDPTNPTPALRQALQGTGGSQGGTAPAARPEVILRGLIQAEGRPPAACLDVKGQGIRIIREGSRFAVSPGAGPALTLVVRRLSTDGAEVEIEELKETVLLK